LSDDLLERGITVTHFGQTDRAQAYLNLINRIEKYSMALMITDDSDFDIEKEENIIFNPKMPLYLVHRTGDIPQYTDLLTDIVLKSGGGVFTDPKEAVEDYWMSLVVAMNQQPISDYSIIDVDDQGIWLYSDSTTQVLTTAYQTKPLATDTFFAKLGNRKLVDYYIARKDTKNLEELDEIHTVAVDAAIVTPFSSYIALENDQQKEELEQAKNKESRFDPDFEKSESLITPSGIGALSVSGTPEPEEWALIIISVFMVLYFYRNKILKWVKDRI